MEARASTPRKRKIKIRRYFHALGFSSSRRKILLGHNPFTTPMQLPYCKKKRTRIRNTREHRRFFISGDEFLATADGRRGVKVIAAALPGSAIVSNALSASPRARVYASFYVRKIAAERSFIFLRVQSGAYSRPYARRSAALFDVGRMYCFNAMDFIVGSLSAARGELDRC